MGQLVEIKKASVRIPAGHVSQGGAAGLKRLKGAGEEAAQSAWKRSLVGKGDFAQGVHGGFLARDLSREALKGQSLSARAGFATGLHSGPVAGGAVGGALAANALHQKKAKSKLSKASRDENSSIGASITLRQPDGKRATVTHAQSRSGAFAGKQRGVGRHLTRDENSSPGKAVVRTPSLREINGKFAGEGQGVKVFHTGQGPGPRSPRDNRVQRWTKGGSKQAKAFVRKADDEQRKGMLGPVDMGSMQLHAGSRVGRRIPVA